MVKTSTLNRVGHGHEFPTSFIWEGTKEDYYTMIKKKLMVEQVNRPKKSLKMIENGAIMSTIISRKSC